MDVRIIKDNVSPSDLLRHFGSEQDHAGMWRCPLPNNHANGDNHPSVSIKGELATCFSQHCFSGDVFAVAQAVTGIHDFPELCDWFSSTFQLNGYPRHSSHTRRIMRAHRWTDAAGRA